MNSQSKKEMIEEIIGILKKFPEIEKIVIFGSFLHSPNPNDLDLAIFQESAEAYLPLALKYRKALRPVSRRFPIDLLPLSPTGEGAFLQEIHRGTVIYEREPRSASVA